jgi:hypothetical protein
MLFFVVNILFAARVYLVKICKVVDNIWEICAL